jgi:hypothetical protein
MRRALLATAILVLVVCCAYGQGTSTEVPSVQPTAGDNQQPMNTWLCVSVLLFGLAIIGVQAWVMHRARTKYGTGKGWGPQSVRLFCLTLIIIAVLFLVTVGYPLNELAAVFALVRLYNGAGFGCTVSPTR